MRLPVVPQVSTKDGISNKNARLTNCLKEVKHTGEMASIRPGLSLATDYAGLGSGLVVFNKNLLTIVDDTVYQDNYTWELDSYPWDAATSYNNGDQVWYGGQLWFSIFPTLQLGNTPSASGNYWRRSFDAPVDTYDPNTAYNIGDSVIYNGQTKYANVQGSQGVAPTNSTYWSDTPPGTSRYQIGSLRDFLGSLSFGGPLCATRQAAAESGWALYPYKSCGEPDRSGNHWFTDGVYTTNGASHWLTGTQWIGDCTASFNQGSGVVLGTIGTVVP